MARPITKPQMSELWLNEFADSRGLCKLCGNHGTIDNRGKLFSPAGVECGDKMFCICPNGRVMKRKANGPAGEKAIQILLKAVQDNLDEFAVRHPTSIERYGDGWLICCSVGRTITLFYDYKDGFTLFEPMPEGEEDYAFDPTGKALYVTEDYRKMFFEVMKLVPKRYRKD